MSRSADLDRFRDLVAARLGLVFDECRWDQVERVLRERALEAGFGEPGPYLDFLESAPGELPVLAERLTVAETYYYRHEDQLRAFVEAVLPARAQRGGRPLRLLSAGCSTGEEPYTLALLLQEHAPERAAQAEILGLDISGAALRRAREGRCTEWSLRATPEELRRRWFRPEGRDFLLDPAVRARVAFEERNLAAEDPAFWRPGSFDAIFCRNVLMYFSPEAMRAAVARFHRCLAPGGFLFLGPAETLRGLSQEFHLCHTHETFYYQAKPLEAGDTAHAPEAPAPLPPTEPPPMDDWPGAIARASARIEALSREAARGLDLPRPAAAPAGALARATELMRRERFGEALGALDGQPAEGAAPEARLLRAILLAQRGAFAEAEALCAEILAADELNAGAHYLAALCREAAGDLEGAEEQDRAAAYLDPGFAMPRLHLGLLARRRGRAEEARRELGLAQSLLLREEPSRILLFGGGFGREALVRLCGAPEAAS